IEEAAGLGRFKARRHRAELKLARVAVEVERARDVEAEVRKRLRPLALQATAAERAQKLAVEIARLRARIAQLDLTGLEERLAEARARHEAAAVEAGDPAAALSELERAWEAAAARAQTAAVERETSAERARQVLARLLVAEADGRTGLEAKLEELLAERREIERELTGAAGEREAALAVSYELRSHVARLSVQRESAERLAGRLRAELAAAEAD